MDSNLAPVVILLMIGVAVFLLVEAAWLSFSRRSSYKSRINRRLRIFENVRNQQDVLMILRRERGLTGQGRYRLPLIWFNRLLTQSGIGVSAGRLMSLVSFPALAALLAVQVWTGLAHLAVIAGLLVACVLPVLALLYLRRKRRRRFEQMLPDAVDIMVRSLRAGHPLPVAIAMVARELPDPIGSEFGMTADEMTYGLDLETAIGNMAARVGQDDLSLLVVAISIQSRTGGNLAEILHNLSNVLRARFKMRRRIKAVSAEGRASAIGLSVLPVAVFCILNLVAPDFYGGVWGDPLVFKVLGFAVGMMAVGNIIMFRMVNFRI